MRREELKIGTEARLQVRLCRVWHVIYTVHNIRSAARCKIQGTHTFPVSSLLLLQSSILQVLHLLLPLLLFHLFSKLHVQLKQGNNISIPVCYCRHQSKACKLSYRPLKSAYTCPFTKTCPNTTTLQNNAARLIHQCKMKSHITPILISLHWLPVATGTEFKVLPCSKC